MVGEFDKVCKRRNLRVNAGKSMDTVFERVREQVIDFAKLLSLRSTKIVGKG